MKRTASGFGLIEVIVYTSLIVIIGVAVTGFMFQLVRVNSRAQTTSQALSDARQALSVVTHEVRHAYAVYDPTSVFDVHPGQLSLETTRNVPSGEETTYIDFYIDDGRLYLKREGDAAQLITSEKVQVSNFVIRHLDTSIEPATVRVELTIAPDGADIENDVTLYTTTSLRSYAQ